jgi:hypothetical protein
MQSTFSSPARFYDFSSAPALYIGCSAELKMLCICGYRGRRLRRATIRAIRAQ